MIIIKSKTYLTYMLFKVKIALRKPPVQCCFAHAGSFDDLV